MRRLSWILVVWFVVIGLETNASAPLAQNRQEACYRVFKNLVAAYGRMQPSQPELKIDPYSNDPASTFPGGQIVISQKTLDLCFGLGADSLNALAFILAHELAHHYNHHLWASNYGTAFASLNWGKHIDSLEAAETFRGYYETQADEFGFFYSYVAGYDVSDIANEVYNHIYQEFHLPAELPGYPSLSQRIKAAELAQEEVKKLIPVFETGKFVSILANGETGNYRKYLLKKSIECFEYIINQKFASREMYHNLGINYLLLALGLEDEKDNSYLYPVVLDEQSRLYDEGGVTSSGDKGAGFGEAKLKDEYLNKAEYYFREALLLDKNYTLAYLNLANVFSLMRQPEDAYYNANKAMEASQKDGRTEMAAHIYDIMAITAAKEGKLDIAKDYFNQALTHGSKIADQNKQVMLGGSLKGLASTDFNMPTFGAKETLAGESLRQWYGKFSQLNNKSFYRFNERSTLYHVLFDQGDFFIVDCGDLRDCPYSDLVFFQFNDTYNQPSARGINKGDKLEEVVGKYGSQYTRFSTSIRSYALFKSANIIFRLDDEDRVTGWAIYYYI